MDTKSRSRSTKLLPSLKDRSPGPTRHQIVNIQVEVGDTISVGLHSSVPASAMTVPPVNNRARSVTLKQLAKATSP